MFSEENFCLVLADRRSGQHRVVDLAPEDRVRLGPTQCARGWSLGSDQSNAHVRIDEPSLDSVRSLGLVPAADHLVLRGDVTPGAGFPEIGEVRNSKPLKVDCLFVISEVTPLRIGRFTAHLFSTRQRAEEWIEIRKVPSNALEETLVAKTCRDVTIITLNLRATDNAPLNVTLEPWGMCYEVPPRDEYALQIHGRPDFGDPTIDIEVSNDDLTVWLDAPLTGFKLLDGYRVIDER